MRDPLHQPEHPLVGDLVELASVPAPTGGEDARIGWLEQRLRHAPGTRAGDAAGNLVWRFGDGPVGLLLLAHVDTVFGPEVALAFERDGGDLVGPGIGDNAAAVVAVVQALERHPELCRPPLAVAFTVGEEGLGNLRGARHACGELRPEAAIAVEGHGLEAVVLDAVGSMRAEVEVRGPGGHSWWDRGTPSAVHGAVALASRLVDGGANVGVFEGGTSVNAIADRARLLVERRSLDQNELDAFTVLLGGLRVPPPLELEVKPLGTRPSGRLAPDHPLAAAVRGTRAALGLPDRLDSGSTDANAALALGIPALAIGCARGALMHSTRERIDVASLELGVDQVAAAVGAVLER